MFKLKHATIQFKPVKMVTSVVCLVCWGNRKMSKNENLDLCLTLSLSALPASVLLTLPNTDNCSPTELLQFTCSNKY